MKRTILILIIFIICISCSNLQKTQKIEEPIILGKTSWMEWRTKSGWDINVNFYNSSDKKILKLKEHIKDGEYTFVVFATSFCDDCKENLPIIFNIFESAQIDSNKTALYGIDHNMQEPSGYYKRFEIPTTPCLFILHRDKIVGTIVNPDYEWLDYMIEIIEEYNDEN